MITSKVKRKVRADSKQHLSSQPQRNPAVNSKNVLKKLSFSFYGEETLKKSKQIIFDNCDLLQDLPVLTEANKGRPIRSYRATHAPSRMSKSKKKGSTLEIEQFFYEKKLDEIDLVPTNASHYDPRSREHSPPRAKGQSRPNISKASGKGGKADVERRNCQTALGGRYESKT